MLRDSMRNRNCLKCASSMRFMKMLRNVDRARLRMWPLWSERHVMCIVNSIGLRLSSSFPCSTSIGGQFAISQGKANVPGLRNFTIGSSRSVRFIHLRSSSSSESCDRCAKGVRKARQCLRCSVDVYFAVFGRQIN